MSFVRGEVGTTENDTGTSYDVEIRTRMVPLVALVLTTSCGGGAPPPAPAAAKCKTAGPQSSPVDGVSTCQARGRVTVEITGAEKIEHSSTQGLVAVEFYKGRLPEQSWLVSLQIERPVAFKDISYRVGFQTAPGTYRGPGRYTLQLQNAQGKPQLSAVDETFLEIVRTTGESKFVRFDRFVKPCTVRVGEKALDGSLECPSLGAADGPAVSMTMRWTAA